MVEPIESLVAFTFDGLRVESVRIADGWHESVPAEHFGTAALASFSEQFLTATRLGGAEAAGTGRLRIPPSAANDLGARAADLAEQAWALLADATRLLEQGPPEEPETAQFHDIDRHVVVETRDGQLVDIAVNPTLLAADPVRIEEALLSALNQYLDATPPDTPTGRLGVLHREHRLLAEAINEYRERP